MTSLTRRAAGTITVLEGAWLLYAYFSAPVTKALCPVGACTVTILYLWTALLVGVILLIAGGLGVWGATFAYIGGALLSAFVLLVAGYTSFLSSDAYQATYAGSAEVSFVVAIVAIVGNAVAMRTRSGISEQANPMNLPVFG